MTDPRLLCRPLLTAGFRNVLSNIGEILLGRIDRGKLQNGAVLQSVAWRQTEPTPTILLTASSPIKAMMRGSSPGDKALHEKRKNNEIEIKNNNLPAVPRTDIRMYKLSSIPKTHHCKGFSNRDSNA
jgi:hypothetical protein